MKTITFYSYKGGVGRSLALSNIAARLSEYQKKVCVLDFDLEAPGLQFKFRNYALPPIQKGIVDYIGYFLKCGVHSDNIKDYSVNLKPFNKIDTPIDFIPAGNIEDINYWTKLSKINWASMFYEENGKGVKFFLDLKSKIEKEIAPDVLLIDSRTGITDIAGITLRLLADEVVVLAANNQENIYGSKKIIKSLLNPQNSLFGIIPKVNFVLTRLPFKDNPRDREKESVIVENIRKEFKTYLNVQDFDVSVIHSDRRLEENEQLLMGHEYDEKDISISNDYLKLFDKVTEEILSKEEINKFNDKRIAQKEFNKAEREKDYAKKIEFLNLAIKLDNTRYEYYWHRGFCCFKLKNYESAIEDYKNAINLNPNMAQLLCDIGSISMELSNFDQAIEYFDKAIATDSKFENSYILKAILLRKLQGPSAALDALNYFLENINPNNDAALNSRADLYRFIGEYEKAFVDIKKAIEINSNIAMYFGTLAEIYAEDNKIDDFYFNLTIALSNGIDAKSLRSAKDLYEKFKNEEKFINLMNKYGVDIEEIFQ